jgi:hypothetical protein
VGLQRWRVAGVASLVGLRMGERRGQRAGFCVARLRVGAKGMCLQSRRQWVCFGKGAADLRWRG